jgi:hypothetical protein
MSDSPSPREQAWPRLDVGAAAETRRTLLLWTQIVGKTRLALAPMVNHWWQVPLYVSARGLTTSKIPYADRAFEIELDLLAHQLVMRTSDGGLEVMQLRDQLLPEFYRGYLQRLAALGIDVEIHPFAVELPESIRFDRDPVTCRYDPDWASRYFRALLQADRLLEEFRGGFIGKASPVHLFWGALDLAVTRFSGRRAPPHPGGYPHIADAVMREAYSHELSSAGFWPGDDRFGEAAFYAYAYPQPPRFAEAAVQPAAARYDRQLGEFVLPYAAVRAAPDPAADVRAFLATTYAAAADLAGWNRADLERDFVYGNDRTIKETGP